MPCKCHAHVDAEGIGKCLKRDKSFNQLFSCFVISPSSCIDASDVPGHEELQKSAVACEDKNEGENIKQENDVERMLATKLKIIR